MINNIFLCVDFPDGVLSSGDLKSKLYKLEKENKKLIDGILSTKPFIDYGEFIDNMYCPFCMSTCQSECSMLSLKHEKNCIYLLAQKMKEMNK